MTAQDVCISIKSSYGIPYSFIITLYSQLISGMIEDLVAVLSEAVGIGNEVDQTETNFNVISNTLANVTSFIAEYNAMINETVSGYKKLTIEALGFIDSQHSTDCHKCDTNNKLTFAMGTNCN